MLRRTYRCPMKIRYAPVMALQRSQIRLGVNVALDGILAAAAVLAASWLATPTHPLPDPPSLPLAGTVVIWLIGVPFGLGRQHWRFTGLTDAVAIGATATLAAVLLTLLLIGVGAGLPSAGAGRRR